MLSISGTREYVCYLTSRLGRMLLIFGTRPRNAEFAQVANAWVKSQRVVYEVAVLAST